MEKEEMKRQFDDKEWEADAVVEGAIGFAEALSDQLDAIVGPIARVERYENMTDQHKSAIAYMVVTRKEALTTLSGALLDKLADAHQKLQ